MSPGPADFSRIRYLVYSLGITILVLAAGLLAAAFALNFRIQTIENIRAAYHDQTVQLCHRISQEMSRVETCYLELARSPRRSQRDSQTDADYQADKYREISSSTSLVSDAIDQIESLQRRFGQAQFEAVAGRLVERRPSLQALSQSQPNYEAYLRALPTDIVAATHQLERLHAIADQNITQRMADVSNQNFLFFTGIAVVLVGAGLFVARRSLRGINVILADNTETHELLSESEFRLRGIFDTTADGIVIIDKKGTVLTFNETATKVFGYRPEEVIGQNVKMLMPDPYTSEHDMYVERYLKTGEAHIIGFRREVTGLRKDGSKFPMDLGVTEMHEHGELLFNGLVRDLSETKKVEEEIFKLHKALAESSNEIYIFDSEALKFSYVNSGALKNLGFTESEMGSMTPLDIKPQYTEEAFRELIGGLSQADSGEIRFETVHKRKDATLYPVDVRLSLTQWQDRPFYLAVILDITDLKRSEEQRSKLEEQVQQAQKLESLGVLAGGIAHDFNNLLVSILGNADLAQQELSPVSPAIASIKEIETASVRAAELCRQMLAYSGKGKFVIEAINLNEVVEEMVHLLEVSISKAAILKFNLAQNLPLIEADATQMRQVVMNLITNASDAIGEKSGVISISTGAIDCDRPYLDSAFLSEQLSEGQYVYLEVADTGSGMDAATQERLFDPFFTTKFTGRGLGLAAVLGIARGHGGAIKVYSELGKGSTFKLLVPASDAALERDRKGNAEAPAAKWKGSGTILLVDDEDTVLSVGRRLLEASGFSVIAARDGVEALEAFRENADKISCVLLDLTMPRMDGEETFRELRKLKTDIPVILSSGYNEQEVSGRFVGKGLAGFIQKPYRLAELRQKLQDALNR